MTKNLVHQMDSISMTLDNMVSGKVARHDAMRGKTRTDITARTLLIRLDDVKIRRGVAELDGVVVAKAVRGAARYVGLEHLANDAALKCGMARKEENVPYPIFETGGWRVLV